MIDKILFILFIIFFINLFQTNIKADEQFNFDVTELEILESIDMMRFLENDIEIQGVFSSSPILGVDRPKDIQKVEEIMTNDTYFHIYKDKYI